VGVGELSGEPDSHGGLEILPGGGGQAKCEVQE
jgi:hypothetical protein